jgi:two-component system response regulator YesN
MRIVLAEDEPKSREGLINVIHRFTDYEIVGVAENGEDGYKLIEELKPDLVISDIRMPILDGLGMLQKIKDQKIEVQAILLSGYSEFEYARKALSLQVVEYVLKPLEVDQFLSILQKVEGKIQKKNAQKISTDQLLWSYIVSSKEEKERMCAMLEEELGVNDHIVSTLFLIHPDSIASETYGEIRKQLQHLLDALCMENYYFIIQQGETGGVFVLLVDTERNRSLKSVFARRIIPQLQDISGCICTMANMHGIRQINQVMDRLVELLKYSFSLGEGVIVDEVTAQTIIYEKLDYPSSLENEIIKCIRNGKRERFIEAGEKFAVEVIDSQASPDCIRDYTVRFIVGVLRVVGDMKKTLNQEEDIQYMLGSINKCHSQREVRYQFEKILKSIAVLDEENVTTITENGIVLNAISFIRENYSDNIGLCEVAQFCNVRSEYLSRIFKEETGVKFVDFLTNFRISMAKRLLFAGTYKVVEVAEMVGFADQKYFQKVFKKVCGVTPSEYKKENCR